MDPNNPTKLREDYTYEQKHKQRKQKQSITIRIYYSAVF